MDWIFSTLQFIGGVILLSGYPFQLWKLYKTKSAKDFSLLWIFLVPLGITFMEFYAAYLFLNDSGQAWFITNTISLFVSWSLFFLALHYKSCHIPNYDNV